MRKPKAEAPTRMRQDGRALLANAQAALLEPLRFGDDRQIRAKRFIDDAHEYYRHLRSCANCQNWDYCPRGMTAHFDVVDAAWALMPADASSDARREAEGDRDAE